MPLGDFSSREPIINQYLGIRPLTTQRNSIQSQRRFHKKLFKPKLLQQRNDRERKFPYTTNKSNYHYHYHYYDYYKLYYLLLHS